MKSSILQTLPLPPFRVCYRVPSTGDWHTHTNLDTESFLLLAELLRELHRPFRSESCSGVIYDVRAEEDYLLLLNSFSLKAN